MAVYMRRLSSTREGADPLETRQGGRTQSSSSLVVQSCAAIEHTGHRRCLEPAIIGER
jgi:hypothetical protein